MSLVKMRVKEVEVSFWLDEQVVGNRSWFFVHPWCKAVELGNLKPGEGIR